MVANLYKRVVFDNPTWVIVAYTMLLCTALWQATNFRLDASSETLVLENDAALAYYRTVRERYGSDDYLIVTYTPKENLFKQLVLDDLKDLRDAFKAHPQVQSVVSILDVPLINSPPVSLSELSEAVPTIDNMNVDMSMVKSELTTSPLYSNALISQDASTTAILVTLKAPPSDLTKQELVSFQQDQIKEIRHIMKPHYNNAELFLGGIPMIVADSISFIEHDLVVFGAGVAGMIVILLWLAFRQKRWVVLPLINCFATCTLLMGFLGATDWPATVVSSNFVAILLIITLSLTVHLIVNFRELQQQNQDADAKALVVMMVEHMATPCFYMSITTIVAFSSLIFSDIRPVIDFGWMMSIGIVIAFISVFTFFPAMLLILPAARSVLLKDMTAKITQCFARISLDYQKAVMTVFVMILVVSCFGLNKLTVENRFIDYYKDHTEIYRGMERIDLALGGTTPLEVIVDAPSDFVPQPVSEKDKDSSGAKIANGYWFNSFMLEDVADMHAFLDELPQTGKVMSLDTTMQMLSSLKDQDPIDSFYLALLYQELPDQLRQVLFDPYISDDGNQLRYSIRVYESDKSLKRSELIKQIETHLVDEIGLDQDQVNVSGMMVLYNHLLQSLFDSQIKTIGVVFFAIFLMFLVLFRDIKIAIIAIIPNIFASSTVLGIMGWAGIPMDIMTITIAAICIGMAVDNTIHYIHRYRKEFAKDKDEHAAAERSHATIGRAMYYTTMTISIGFSILVFSNFVPTIYFGILTAAAMLVALAADMTLLPVLLMWLKPLKR